jgi:signal peptidase I
MGELSDGPKAGPAEDGMTKKRDKHPLREYFELLVETAVFALFVLTFVVQAFQIPSGSMIPKLLIGDFLLVNKTAYAAMSSPVERLVMPSRPLRRGDIIVFKWPGDLTKDFVKRVIGLPGERVEIRARQLYIDDRPIAEPYKVHRTGPARPGTDQIRSGQPTLDDYGPIVVPPGALFVMGDNRDESADSRSWGLVPRANVKGRPWLVYFSYTAEPGAYLKTGLSDRIQKLVWSVTRARWSRFLKVIN